MACKPQPRADSLLRRASWLSTHPPQAAWRVFVCVAASKRTHPSQKDRKGSQPSGVTMCGCVAVRGVHLLHACQLQHCTERTKVGSLSRWQELLVVCHLWHVHMCVLSDCAEWWCLWRALRRRGGSQPHFGLDSIYTCHKQHLSSKFGRPQQQAGEGGPVSTNICVCVWLCIYMLEFRTH